MFYKCLFKVNHNDNKHGYQDSQDASRAKNNGSSARWELPFRHCDLCVKVASVCKVQKDNAEYDKCRT